MRLFWAVLFVCAGSILAQTDEAPEVARAKSEIEKLKVLVDAGAAAKAQLEKAEAGLADAEDAALLRKTVYGAELTDGQAADMLAAAQRRVDRRRAAYE